MIDDIGISNAEGLPPVLAIYRWGIALIQGIQGIQSPGLTALVKIITTLGTELFYVPAILLIFWCVDEKKGARLGFIVMLSAFINGFFKDLLKQPRPFALEPSVGLAFEPSYGIPSGHAQLSLCFALPLALWLGGSRFGKSPKQAAAIRLGAALFVLIIAFTRLYLGVHFPTDILTGWLLGGLFLALWFALEGRVTPLLEAGVLRVRLVTVAILAIAMNALSPADRSIAGLFLGFGAGYALSLEHIPFSAGAGVSVLARGLRFTLGIAGGALIYLILKALFPGEDSALSALPSWGAASPYYDLGRFARYGLLGLWASAGAPWVFRRLGLAKRPGV
jgi:membrane-associated phospholipid phosphatase